MVTIKFNGLDRLRSSLDPKNIRKASKASLRVLARMARVQISKDVRKHYTNIKAARIKSAVFVSPPTDAGIRISFSGKDPGLLNFKVSHNSYGRNVKANVLKSTGLKTLAKAFVAKSSINNKYSVWIREGSPRKVKYGKYKGQTKQPLQRLTSVSIPAMVKRVATKSLQVTMDKNLENVVDREIDRYDK